MQEIITKIEQWANDRNLITGSTPLDQSMKLFSEFGELCDAIAKNDIENIKDGIGDVLVVCTVISKQINLPLQINLNERLGDLSLKRYAIEVGVALHEFAFGADRNDLSKLPDSLVIVCTALNKIAINYGLTLEQCLEHSYNEIRYRKGIMHDGVFVKADDPRYASLGGI